MLPSPRALAVARRHPAFRWDNTMLVYQSRDAITGTYRALQEAHGPPPRRVRVALQSSLRSSMIPGLGRAAVTTKPQPYWWLKMADYGV